MNLEYFNETGYNNQDEHNKHNKNRKVLILVFGIPFLLFILFIIYRKFLFNYKFYKRNPYWIPFIFI